MRAWLKRWSLWIAVILVAAVFGGRGQIEAEKLSGTVEDVAALTKQNTALTRENRALVTSLQSAVVESCVENGNASRRVARETLMEEIHAAQHPDPVVLKAFDIPPAKLKELIDANVAKLRLRLSRVKAVNCAEQYQISPGSGNRRRDRTLDSSAPNAGD